MLWYNCTADGAQDIRLTHAAASLNRIHHIKSLQVPLRGCVRCDGDTLISWLWGRLLTERSCVCWLGEIFWHLPVDIESKEKENEKGEPKEKKGKGK